MSLENKKILLVIGGGISAYKSLDLIRLLQKKGCSVKVVLTKSGKKFVTNLSISSLLKKQVFEETFENNNKSNHCLHPEDPNFYILILLHLDITGLASKCNKKSM